MTQPPLEGMKVVPVGAAYMLDMFVSCAAWALSQDELREQFQAETGHNLDALLNRSAIEKAIDESTGFERAVLTAWMDWVASNIWGVEETR